MGLTITKTRNTINDDDNKQIETAAKWNVITHKITHILNNSINLTQIVRSRKEHLARLPLEQKYIDEGFM